MTSENDQKRERRVLVTLRVSPHGRKAVQDYADRHGLTWSEAARRALARGIQELT
jgi:hypothetical protein